MLRYRLPLLITLSLLCGLFVSRLTAQPVYPVRTLTQLTPPYSVYLSDYAAPGVEQLRVMLVQNDLTKPATQIRLSMELQLNGRLVLRTSPTYRPAPLTLTSAMPLVVNGNNLSGFLEPQNLDFIGISRDNYLRTKALPEGAYTLSFTAYDYHRPQVRVSQPGVATFYLSKSEPPMLNLPLDGQTLEATPLPSVLFQWTPRATASLNSAFDTEYKLQLYEVMVPGSNPYQVVNSSQPVFERSLSTSTYLYGPLDPTLVAGRQYLWRVQARDRSGRDRFRNQGFSQVYEFTYGQDLASQLPLIEGLTATTTGSRARINWTSNPAFDRYTLQYRRQGEYSWVDQSVTTLPVDIHQLAYDIPYECRVQGIQGVYKSQWSQPVSFTSPKPQPVACGTPYEPKAITNHQPITKLLPMQEVDAGGFTVTILQATPSGDRFSGRGYVQLPFWGNKRFAVTFSNIKVNTDFQLTDGKFVTVFDERNSQLGNIDEVFEGTETRMQTGATSTTFAVNLGLDPNQPVQVNLQGQTLTFTDAQGHTQTLPLPAKASPEAATANNDTTALQPAIDQTTVEDSQGNIYRIDYQPGSSSAQLTRIGSASSGTTINYPSLSPELAVVSFEAHPEQQYAFDSWNPAYEASQIWESRYEKLGDYRVPFKLLPQGKTDVVKATVQLTDTSLDPAKVVFKSSKGAEFTATFTNGYYQLTLVGGPANDIQEVYALYPSGDGFKALGKIKAVSYAPKQVSVTLVPTAGQTIDITQLQTGLNQIYNPLGVQVTLSVDRSFTYTGTHPSFTGSGWFDTYTLEMKALNQAYQAHAGTSFKPNEAYVFVLPGSGPIAGDMPRGKQFGYLTGTPGAQVLAHELAHGVFHLKHTFDPDYGLAEGTLPQNLMDYRGGTLLNKPQWDGLHDPGLVLGVFEKDEDGAMINGGTLLLTNIQEIINQIRQGNKDKKSELPMKITTGLGEYDKMTLGSKDYSYIKMSTSGFDPLFDKESTATIQTNAGQVTIPTERPSYNIKPSELSKTTYKENGTKYTKYQFHELQIKQNNAPYADTKETTGKVRIELCVKDDDQTAFENYLFGRDAPAPGDPLIFMEIVGTISTSKIGGTYGCVRWTDVEEESNCDDWSANIINFPKVTGKNKVHDGIDLLAATSTPVYAMFDGTATVATSKSLGSYILIKSEQNEHNLNGINEAIWCSYGHLSICENLNGKVSQGQLIGYTGNSGSTASNIEAWRYHLHLTVYKGGTNKYNRTNPLLYLTTKFDSNGNKID